MDGHPIANDGTIAFRHGERIAFQYLFNKRFVGEPLCLEVFRKLQVQNSTTESTQQNQSSAVNQLVKVEFKACKQQLLVPMDPPPLPQYYIVGGLVFIPLTEPFLRCEFGDDFDKSAPVRLVHWWQNGEKEKVNHEIVLLSQVLAHDINIGYHDLKNIQLLKFQGKPVSNLKALVDCCEKEVQNTSVEFLRFELQGGDLLVLRREDIKGTGPEILKRSMIPSHFRL